MSELSFAKMSSKHCLSQTVRAREPEFWENVHPLPRVTCHMSRVTCHLSPKMLFLKSFISWVEDQNLTTFVVGLRATKFNTSLAWVVVKEPLKCEHELRKLWDVLDSLFCWTQIYKFALGISCHQFAIQVQGGGNLWIITLG